MLKKLYPIFKNGVFRNGELDSVIINTKKIILHYALGIFNFSHLYASGKHNAAIPQSIKYKDDSFGSEKISITPLGHASILISCGKFSIVVDPVFYAVSLFFKRFTSDIVSHLMPKIDVVIYSHNHPDHFCRKTLQEIIKYNPEVKIFGPLEFNQLFKHSCCFFKNKKEVITLNWWQEYCIHEDVVLTALPAIHWSQSNLFDRNKSLWASWMIKINKKYIYFAGDSAYGEHFKLIQKSFPPIDVACLPVAPYEPRDIQIDSHMNTEESYSAFDDLKAHFFLPIHWGVFAYGDEKLKEPIQKIILIMKKQNILSRLIGTVYHQRIFF